MADPAAEKRVLTPTEALGRLALLADLGAAFAAAGEILTAAKACEAPAARLAQIEADIAAASAELDKIGGDLGSVRENHARMLADLATEEREARKAIADGLEQARAEAGEAIAQANASKAAAELARDQAIERTKADTEAAERELAVVRAKLSELRAGIPAG